MLSFSRFSTIISESEESPPMKILFVCGSLRNASLNRQLACAARNILEDRADISFLDFEDVPIFSQDTEFPTPASVQACRNAFQEADGIWFFTPEYNEQMPGGLKNLLDWMSRPVFADASQKQTALYGKKAAISGIGGHRATVGSRALLKQNLEFCKAQVLEDSEGFSMSKQDEKTSQLEITLEMEEALKKEADAFVAMLEG